MKIDITEKVFRFREAARNLWNAYLRESADWDSVDTFNEICLSLFQEIVLREGVEESKPIGLDRQAYNLSNYFISSNGGSRFPIQANREIPPSGYWDYPITWLPSEAEFEIKPISFFDFDLLGWRDLEYLRVLIEKCPLYPELEGREALVNCRYAKIEVIENA